MELLPKELLESLPKMYSTDRVPLEEKVFHIKYFTPDGGWTWYVVEAEQEGDNVVFFGLVDGMEREWGYFDLKELMSILGPMGLPVERDIHFGTKTIKEIL